MPLPRKPGGRDGGIKENSPKAGARSIPMSSLQIGFPGSHPQVTLKQPQGWVPPSKVGGRTPCWPGPSRGQTTGTERQIIYTRPWRLKRCLCVERRPSEELNSKGGRPGQGQKEVNGWSAQGLL